jgi:hypothetical protein
MQKQNTPRPLAFEFETAVSVGVLPPGVGSASRTVTVEQQVWSGSGIGVYLVIQLFEKPAFQFKVLFKTADLLARLIRNEFLAQFLSVPTLKRRVAGTPIEADQREDDREGSGNSGKELDGSQGSSIN